MMKMAFTRLTLAPFVVAALGPLLLAQVKPREAQTKPSPLKLEIIPEKKNYRVGEAIVVRYKLTNLSDTTVGFPRPGTSDRKFLEGYVSTSAINNKGEENLFIESYWPRDARTDQDLLSEANEKWIKLPPGLSYLSETASPVGSLAVGGWKLQSTYVPPYLRGRAKLILDALSCTPPETGATSIPVRVTVVTALESH